MRRSSLFFLVAAVSACGPASTPHVASPAEVADAKSSVARLLDAWHDAAARADETAYFGFFSKDAVFLGTDATERWDVGAFRAYAHPHFAKGKAWSFKATRRAISVAQSGDVVFFDEDLATPNLGPARGSGVAVRDGSSFKLSQYNLSVPIPNERFGEVKRLLEAAAGAPKLAAEAPPPPAFSDPDRAAKVAALVPKIDALADAEHKAQKLPSLALALVVDGKVAAASVRGVQDVASQKSATRETVYRIGSITKTFTAEALLVLRDRGKLALDDRLDRHLPEAAAIPYEPKDARPITLRQVLTHTSGLPRLGDFDYTRGDRDVPESEVLAALPKAHVHAPGTRYLYSNFGMGLLGIVVSRVSGKPFRAFVKDALFEPLGMSSAAFDAADVPKDRSATGYKTRASTTPEPAWRLGASEGAGGIYASLDDMARWVAFQLDAWPPRDDDDTGPLSRASRREAHASSWLTKLDASVDGGKLRADAETVGLAWHTDRTCAFDALVRHSGAIDGFHASIVFAPDRGFGLVALANSLDADTERVVEKALALVAASDALRPRVDRPTKGLADAIDRFARSYDALDEATYKSLFTDTFRAAVPWSKMREIGATMSKVHGACGGARIEKLDSPTSGVFRIACKNGAIVATATAHGAELGGLFVRPAGLPASKELRAAADQILALSRKWDRASFAKSFSAASQKEEEKIREVLAELEDKRGGCKIDGPDDGDGERRATFDLSCGRGAATSRVDLVVGLSTDAKVSEMFVRPRSGGRCTGL